MDIAVGGLQKQAVLKAQRGVAAFQLIEHVVWKKRRGNKQEPQQRQGHGPAHKFLFAQDPKQKNR